MAREFGPGPEWGEFRELALDIAGFYVALDRFEERLGPKQRKEVIDLNVAQEVKNLAFNSRGEARDFLAKLLNRVKYNPRIPKPEKDYLEPKLNATWSYLAALDGHRFDFNHYAYETLIMWPREFEEGDITEEKSKVFEDLKTLGYDLDFKTAIENFRQDNMLNEEEILNGVQEAAKKFLPFIKEYTGIDVEPMYRIVPVKINAPWRAWLRSEEDEIILEINLTHPDGFVRGQEERVGLHEIPIHGAQIASWARSAKLGRISPASCITTLHTPEQISVEGLATALPLVESDVFPLSPYGELSIKMDYLERIVLYNAHIRANLLSPIAGRDKREEIVDYVVDHLPYMKPKNVRDILDRRVNSELDRSYELSYAEGARLHFKIFEELGRDHELFRLLVREEFVRPMTADQIIILADNLRINGANGIPNSNSYPSSSSALLRSRFNPQVLN